MIHSFSCELTKDLFSSRSSKKFVNIERVARRKLLQLHAAVNLLDLSTYILNIIYYFRNK